MPAEITNGLRRDYPEEAGKTKALFAAADRICPDNATPLEDIVAGLTAKEAAMTKALFATASTIFECQIPTDLEREQWNK